MNDNMDEGRIAVRHDSCKWGEATRTKEDSKIQKESNDDEVEEERGEIQPNDEDKKKQKLYNIANELLQTERAYVARLHLLDQVSVASHFEPRLILYAPFLGYHHWGKLLFTPPPPLHRCSAPA